MVAQISYANAKTGVETKIKMVQGQLVIPDRIVRIESGISRYDEDQIALSKVGQVKVISRDNRQCVPFVREKSGKSVYGLAKLNPINSAYPEIGAVVKTNESWTGHLAWVVDESMSTITIRETNFRSGLQTQRTLLRSDGRILGFII